MMKFRVEAKTKIFLAALLMGGEKTEVWSSVLSGAGVCLAFLLSILFFHFTKRLFPKKYLEISKILWVAAAVFLLKELMNLPMLSGVCLLLLMPQSLSEIHSRLYFKKGVLQAALFLTGYLWVVGVGDIFFDLISLGILSALISSEGFKKTRWAYV